VTYAQNQDKTSFVNNMTTVLLPSESFGTSHEDLLGVSKTTILLLKVPRQSKWLEGRIIPVQCFPNGVQESEGEKNGLLARKRWSTNILVPHYWGKEHNRAPTEYV
jgi:hypothetical protein